LQKLDREQILFLCRTNPKVAADLILHLFKKDEEFESRIFYSIQSYISSAIKQNRDVLELLKSAFEEEPVALVQWLNSYNLP